jgi:hypothetical protein
MSSAILQLSVKPVHALAIALRLQGFVPVAPGEEPDPAVRAEEAACRSSDCRVCLAKGLLYHPFHKGKQRRGLVECPACNHAFLM